MAILRKLQIWQEFIGLAKIKTRGMSIIVGFTKMTNLRNWRVWIYQRSGKNFKLDHKRGILGLQPRDIIFRLRLEWIPQNQVGHLMFIHKAIIYSTLCEFKKWGNQSKRQLCKEKSWAQGSAPKYSD